ncbi:hypothetical protein X760_32890 [Mesorhizobium sp. LSHC422A00]|nr:hypothetical protein X760_32890 [Mesorhizobium sp. LSHC422A00]
MDGTAGMTAMRGIVARRHWGRKRTVSFAVNILRKRASM